MSQATDDSGRTPGDDDLEQSLHELVKDAWKPWAEPEGGESEVRDEPR